MAALGCLLPFILLVAGALAGSTIGQESATHAYIGGAIGLVIGLAVPAIILWGMYKKRTTRRDRK